MTWRWDVLTAPTTELSDDPCAFCLCFVWFILSGLMSAVVSAIATWRALGMNAEFSMNGLGSWLTS
ncbi:DUF2798 domain-containing protein [Pseudorhodobacter ferrugineus]|uniref:DUF2798 domain-containing protein n=1 Tax=Pseudorhodobacter ferrugineus TaxID=77008 RepID=UPI0004077367